MKIIVNPHKIELLEQDLVNEKEIDISKCEFEFNEIPNDYVKEAYFTLNGNTYKQILVNNECKIPNEVLVNKGMVEIGCVAYKVDGNDITRYNPSPVYINTLVGSLKQATNTEPITPSDKEQIEQIVTNAVNDVNNAVEEVNSAIQEVNTAIDEVNNLDLDVNKVNKTATVEITKKDNTTKSVNIYDGVGLEFNWIGTRLGVKTENDSEYTYVNLQGIQGEPGPQGEPFIIKKTYSSVEAMNADFDNMQYGDYVMIASSVEVQDNAKLYTKGEVEWIFITDFSGATGIQGQTGLTPNIQIGTVTSGTTPSVTRSGTDENPILNFVLEKGDTGATGQTGQTGATGNGISTITKTSSVGLVDTYTITYTNGNTTTYEVTNGEDGEVTEEQLDKVQRELDRYKLIENALPHVSGTGTSITLNNVVESPLHINLQPNTSQDTTTGYNIIGMDTQQYKVNLTAGTILTLRNEGTRGLQLNLYANYGDTTRDAYWPVTNGNRVVTLTRDAKAVSWSTEPNGNAWAYVGDSVLGYEEYSGNIPSPNPSYPQNIKVVTGDNTIKVQNKNLLNIENSNIHLLTNWDGTTDINNNYNSMIIDTRNKSSITISGDFTNIEDGGIRYGLYTQYPSTSTTGTRNNLSASGTINTTNANYILLSFAPATNKTFANIQNSIQVEYGSTATNFVEHQEQTYLISLGDIEYCEIGDNKDRIFKNVVGDVDYSSERELGKWYIKKNIPKLVFNGTEEGWSYVQDSSIPFKFTYSNMVLPESQSKLPLLLTSHYLAVKWNDLSNYTYAVVMSSSYQEIRFKNGDISSLSDWKTWLSTHNVTAYCVTTTPTYTILPNELQTQLDNLYNAISYDEQTNINQVNADLPFNLEASALKDISNL